MEHIAAIMMLVGCTAADTKCRELPAPSVGFETVENCQELLRPAVEHLARANSVVYGKCVDVDPALFIEDAVITWQITADKQLDVNIDFDGQHDMAQHDMAQHDMAMNEAGTVPKTSRLVN